MFNSGLKFGFSLAGGKGTPRRKESAVGINHLQEVSLHWRLGDYVEGGE